MLQSDFSEEGATWMMYTAAPLMRNKVQSRKEEREEVKVSGAFVVDGPADKQAEDERE